MSELSTERPVREEQRPARDEVEEVAPGILRLQLPISFPGLGHVNCYLMEDRHGMALIDPGLPGIRTWRRLRQLMRTIGSSPRHVHTVVVTHSHPDHFGQVPRLRKVAGAEIVTHRSFRTFLDPEAEQDDQALSTRFEEGADVRPADHGADDRVDLGRAGAGPSPFGSVTPWGGKPYELPISRRIRYRVMRWAAGRFVAAPRPTRRVEDADVLELGNRGWVAVHTPGHTEDHLCLWDPDSGVMISGDHVLPTITPHISGLSESPDPLAQFFDSLERMKSYSTVGVVLPAHGLEFDNLAERVEAITRHHNDRLDALRRAGDVVGRGTVQDYMKQLFNERSWGSMAESETYAHLEHLRLLQEADVDRDGPQLRYAIRS